MGLNVPRMSGRLGRCLALSVVACATLVGLGSVPVASADTQPVPSLPVPSPHPGHKIEFPTQAEWHNGRGNGHYRSDQAPGRGRCSPFMAHGMHSSKNRMVDTTTAAACKRRYSGCIPAAFATLAHFSVSARR